MKGNRLLYLGAIVSVGFATIFTVINPLVLKVTIDSLIGDQPLADSGWELNLINAMGGRGFLAQRLWIVGLLLIVLTLGRGLFLFLRGKWSAEAAEMIAKNMREKLYGHLQHLYYNYYVTANTGDIIQRCTSDLDTIRRFLAIQFVEIGRSVFMLSLVAYVMFSLHVKMALVAMAVIPIIFAFGLIFFLKVKKAFRFSDEAEGRLSTVLQENLTGVRVVKAFARQSHEMEKFEQKNREYRDLTYRLIKLLAGYWSLSDFLCLLQIAVVLFLGVYWTVQGSLTLGTLFVFITYEGFLLWPVRQMGRILTDMGQSFVAVERIEEILQQPSEQADPSQFRPEIKGNISFRNVNFQYEDGTEVLKDITFTIKAGQTIAILGATGSGKSSLVHLLARLYDYQRGSITIDGNEVRSINKKWLRKHIGLVLQEPFLFAKTISDNISLARLESEEREIYAAASDAAIHNVILDFDQGYDTLVGERGVSLSGGQKQRVAIARTLIRECPILIFDDSLSAVDTETDAAIRRALAQRGNQATTIIISHRVATLAHADLILVLEEGRLVEQGTHQELLHKSGIYSRVWAIQNSLEDELNYELSI
ncbi:MAG: ABC transporter ATP-binding protein/permease [Halanaerobiales bacterium]|nr:ABC transporter ATP-binding protein/permease [Halanaerobiales bacterium]